MFSRETKEVSMLHPSAISGPVAQTNLSFTGSRCGAWQAMSNTKAEMNADKKKKRIIKTEQAVEAKKPKVHDAVTSKVCLES